MASSLASEFSFTFAYTRKAQGLCDDLTPRLHSTHTLHTLMSKMTATCSELAPRHVLLEVPSMDAENFHISFLKFTSTLKHAGKQIVAVCQPNLRKRVARSVWIERWNKLENPPFRFSQTCSCKFGDTSEHHHAIYIGTTCLTPPGPCHFVPDTGMADVYRLKSLRQVLTWSATGLEECPPAIG